MNYDQLLSRVGLGMQQSAIRQMGTVAAQNPDIISFAPGYPNPANFPWDDYAVIADAILRARDRDVLQYGPTRGLRDLLEAISELAQQRGIGTRPAELMVTTGSQQGLDLVGRVFLDPGDVALVELPSYTGAITAFRNAQATLVGIRQQDDGLDLDHLEHTLARLRQEGRRVKFVYVVPNFQNPTGLLLSLEKRRRLLELASHHDLLIVEDDPYGDLYFEDTAGPTDTRPVKADDTEGRVIYLSSFSKTLSPALRVAWMAAPASLIEKFETAKQCLDLCTSDFNQRIVLEAIRRGVLARQVPRLRAYYQSSRTTMEEALRAHLGEVVSWLRPRGGFFLWASLPPQVHTGHLLERAMRRGVIYVAGQPFFVDGSGTNTLRLAFCLATADRIVEGVARLASAVLEVVEGARGTPTPVATG